MKLFGKNQLLNDDANYEKEEELRFLFVTRLEPVVYARLGDDGVDVKAKELIDTIERLEAEGSVFTYEVNSLIADYLIRTNAIKIKKYSGSLNKYVINKRQELMDIMMRSKDVYEKYQESYRCEYICEKCGEKHYINASHFKADIDFSILGGIRTEIYYKNIPTHLAEDNKMFSGTNEMNALAKYRMMHKMDPLHLSIRTDLKQALVNVVNRIYQDSGVRECNIYVFGKPYNDFMKDFFPDSISGDRSTAEFIRRMSLLEQTVTEHSNGIADIRAELNELEIEKHRKSVEELEAKKLNDYEKVAKIMYDTIPSIEKQSAEKTKQLWKLLLKEYKCK